MPSIGKDLSKIRNARGLSLQEIHEATKIPLTTLQSIENGSIFDEPEQGKTYVRSFVRSFGRALKIDDDVLINGLDQQETGNYNHLVWNHYESARASAAPGKFTLDDEYDEPDQTKPTAGLANKSGTKVSDKVHSTSGMDSKEIPPDDSIDDPNLQSDSGKKPEKDKSESEKTAEPKASPSKQKTEPDVNWVDMGHKFIEPKKKTPVVTITVIILLILAAAGAFFIIQGDYFATTDHATSDSPATATTANQQNGSILDLSDPAPPEVETPVAVELDEVLYLTVYAAYQRLDPVRVWSDLKPRMDPYWIEQGVAMNFDFQDTVRVRGQYSNLLLFMNGHLIQSPMEQHYNSSENYIELTREFFLEDPSFQTTVSFQTPDDIAEPDSVLLRPSF